MPNLDDLGQGIEDSQILLRATLHGVQDPPSALIVIREK
jgi:hypothetical protein